MFLKSIPPICLPIGEFNPFYIYWQKIKGFLSLCSLVSKCLLSLISYITVFCSVWFFVINSFFFHFFICIAISFVVTMEITPNSLITYITLTSVTHKNCSLSPLLVNITKSDSCTLCTLKLVFLLNACLLNYMNTDLELLTSH